MHEIIEPRFVIEIFDLVIDLDDVVALDDQMVEGKEGYATEVRAVKVDREEDVFVFLVIVRIGLAMVGGTAEETIHFLFQIVVHNQWVRFVSNVR